MKRSEALNLRKHIENAVQSLPDADALDAMVLNPVWKASIAYTVGYKAQHIGKLWRCRQAHTSQEGWEPENVPALWEEICETHDGTLADPIPYEGSMTLVAGLHYVQDGKVYLCNRDTVNPVYNALAELVGIYVEIVN